MKIRICYKETTTILKRVCFKQNGSKLCIFSHFDASCIVEPYVVQYIKSLRRFGYEIIFVSTSNIKLSYTRKITKYIKELIVRKNIGYDFTSYKIGLSFIEDYTRYESILFANDSIFFPLHNPKKMFDDMRRRKLDLWSITSSNEKRYHLQSFFLSFQKKAISSKAFALFWNSLKILGTKEDVISTYELSLSEYFINKSFRVGAYISFKELLKSYAKNSCIENYLFDKNPFFFFWEKLVSDFKVPYIKKNILISESGQYNVTTKEYAGLIQSKYYDISLIETMLKRYIDADHGHHLKVQEIDKDIEKFLKKVEFYFENNDVAIYGANHLGIFLADIFSQNTKILVDRDSSKLNGRLYMGVDDPHLLDGMTFDCIIVTTLAHRECIYEGLDSLNVDMKKVIFLSDIDDNIHMQLECFIRIINSIYVYHIGKDNFTCKEYLESDFLCDLYTRYLKNYMLE